MKIESIDVNQALDNARKLLDEESNLPNSIKAIINVLILLVTILASRLNINSSNSSKPPSTDPNRKRKQKEKSDKKRGGQIGHKGSRLDKVKNPDKFKLLKLIKKHFLQVIIKKPDMKVDKL